MVGVHLVAGELGRRKWIPTITAGNVPLVDILAMSPDHALMVAVQVKAVKSSNRDVKGRPGWMIKEENIRDSIHYVLVEVPVKDDFPLGTL